MYEKIHIFVNDYSAVKEHQADYVAEDDDGRCKRSLTFESTTGHRNW